MNQDWGFAVLPIIGVAMIGFLVFGGPYLLAAESESTGVCIFKGPAFYSTGIFGGTSSSGVPLRGIGVTAYFINGWGNQLTIAAGSTDRMGCFTFQSNHDSQYLAYSYNGTS